MANRKGGSAKTVTALNLSGALAENNLSVLLIDLDPQGSLTHGLGIESRNLKLSEVLIKGGEGFTDIIQPTAFAKINLIPSDSELNGIEIGLKEVPGRELRLRRCINKFLLKDFDYIIIDCPPSLGSLTINALVAAREVLVPVDCSSYGREALASTLATIEFTQEEINYNLKLLGILVCNVNIRTTYDQLAEASIREQFGNLVFETIIPNSIRIDEAAEAKKPVIYYDSGATVSNRFRELAKEVIKRGNTSD